MSASPRPAVPPGLVVVDKPDGMTSHDVVAKVRRILGTRKVGHAGTLDPMATGVLVLGVERATKLLGHLALDSKAYLSTIRLGASTTTDDAEGEVLSTADSTSVPEDAIRAGVAKLTGAIQQVPSAVSAVKVDGKRAYARVRAGEEVELPPRPVTVHRFDVLSIRREADATELDVMVECSSGTYVRALARDLGADLGVGGHLAALRRTRVGPFDLRVARTLEQLADAPGLSLDLDASVSAAFPRREITPSEVVALSHGQRLRAGGLEGTYGVFGPDGHAVALAKDEGELAKPVVVLTPAG
ncbi:MULTISPECIES: tRNA pseudouridine(55) synthase TruB [Actinosynnema]|uniref:tRNA pseudouridine(55) synthase TruB n=1 Tax=Actinosynnema TaxID=40566 RepID=UPI0027E26FB4|nr:tRNA pseudouridine(55) synthase TruB [Actinosynnema pretiosum]MCP2094064.1 tRNA pseudouridine synthase B [Actinosynnema pretiosum]